MRFVWFWEYENQEVFEKLHYKVKEKYVNFKVFSEYDDIGMCLKIVYQKFYK